MTYDAAADGFYLELVGVEPGGVKETRLCLSTADIALDFDEQGRLVGIEIESALSNLPGEILEQCERIG